MDSIRKAALAILDKVDKLLTTEPARLIGYGAAGVVFIVLKVCEAKGLTLFPQASFDEVLGVAFTAIATTVILVESIRRFVFSPQTYIEDLADESQAAHEAAHLEEDMQRLIAAAQAQQAKPRTRTVTVGTAKAAGSDDKAN